MNHVTINNKDNQNSEPEEMDTREDESMQTQNETGGDAFCNGDMKENQPSQEEAMEEEDEARSEATFRFVVPHLSKLKETLLSPPTYVRNLPWYADALTAQLKKKGS